MWSLLLAWLLLRSLSLRLCPCIERDLEEEHRLELAELGCRVFGVNPADARSHASFAQEIGLGFPLLVDQDGRVAEAYQCRYTPPAGLGGTRVLRSVYLINPAGTIRLSNRGAPSIAAVVRMAKFPDRGDKYFAYREDVKDGGRADLQLRRRSRAKSLGNAALVLHRSGTVVRRLA